MMMIFFDTEFTGLVIEPKLISIGLISEDGREFYAELTDTFNHKDCEDFTREAVLPHLTGGDARMTFDNLTLRLGNWLESFEQSVELVTDSLSWDWPWIQELFSTPCTWPQNLARKPLLLRDIASTVTPFFAAAAAESAIMKYKLRRHHSLDDAKAHRFAWLAIDRLTPDEIQSLKKAQDDAVEHFKKKNHDLKILKG